MRALTVMSQHRLCLNHKPSRKVQHQQPHPICRLVLSTVPHHPNMFLLVLFACCTTWEISSEITSVLLVTVACSLTENAAKNCGSGKLPSAIVRTIMKILQIIRR